MNRNVGVKYSKLTPGFYTLKSLLVHDWSLCRSERGHFSHFKDFYGKSSRSPPNINIGREKRNRCPQFSDWSIFLKQLSDQRLSSTSFSEVTQRMTMAFEAVVILYPMGISHRASHSIVRGTQVLYHGNSVKKHNPEGWKLRTRFIYQVSPTVPSSSSVVYCTILS